MRILLIWPNSLNNILGWGDLGAIAEPLALEYLGSALAHKNHDVQILDLRLHPDSLVKTLANYHPDMVGITAYSMHVNKALAIAKEVKYWKKSCMTIVGGHHATFLPEDFFHSQIDYVVSGEGTKAICAVADTSTELHNIAGLWLRTDSNINTNVFSCQRPNPTPTSQDINSMLPPDRSLTLLDRHRYFIDWMRPVALLRTTLGCPYRCSFCSIWKAVDGRYLRRDIDSVIHELKTIKEKWVFLIDDEAFINKERMLLLARAIKHAGIDKSFFTYCRIDTLIKNKESIVAWRDIGLKRLFIGIDAISSKDLDEYNKKCNIYQIEQGLILAKELNIEIFAQFVVNTNYSKKDFKKLIRFIEHHGIDYPSFTVLTPLPGTDMLDDFSLITEFKQNNRPNWDLFDCQNVVTRSFLPKEIFRQTYRNLYHVFKGSYTQYREHNFLMK